MVNRQLVVTAVYSAYQENAATLCWLRSVLLSVPAVTRKTKVSQTQKKERF